MDKTPAEPRIEGKMFLFRKPELLTREKHGELGLASTKKRYGFCSTARVVPVTVSEIPAAIKNYPVVFLSGDNPVMVAVTGLVDEVNLFVDEDGNWDENCYIPGYVRRYPFGIASETGGDRAAVVLDAGFEGVKKKGERALFSDGEPSELTKQAIGFCKSYEADRLLTEKLSAKFSEYGLIREQTAQYTPQNEKEPRNFARYSGLDEVRVKELEDDRILEMRKDGSLAIVYAVLISMGNWRTLLERRSRRFKLSENQLLDQAVH